MTGAYEENRRADEATKPYAPSVELVYPLAHDRGVPLTPSDTTKEIVRQVLERDQHGRQKYGVTLDRPDLTVSEWLQHMAEELMDGAGYALAAKREHTRQMKVLVTNAMLSIRVAFPSATLRDAYMNGMQALQDAIFAELDK